MFADACVALPDPPATEDLSGLVVRYDQPTGRLPDELTTELLAEAQPYLDVASQLDGLSLIHTAVAETSLALGDDIPVDILKVQGTIRARFSCPGHARVATDDADTNGTLDITMGVADTKIQRAISGTATDCRFASSRRGASARITFSADFVADLGGDVELGEDPPDLLTIQLSDLELGNQAGLSVPDLQETYDFRVTEDKSIEVLLDPSMLGLRSAGTLVLISHLDGSVGLREARGEWNCPPDGSCSLTRR